MRYETAPGEQGQADWAYHGRLRDGQGKGVVVYAFLLELGFANVRVHATTLRRPLDLWLVEQSHLLPVTGVPAYRLATRAVRKVSSACWVHFQGVRYSMPPTHVGQSVLVELHSAQQRVIIRADQVIIADHPQATTRGATVSDPAHLAALWQVTLAQSTAPPSRWQHSDSEAVETRALAVYEALVS